MTVDILDRIDQLVDEQMAGGEPRNGYDFNDPTYPDCWHCGRKWHGLPVTQKIAEMYSVGRFDEDYRVDTDDSPVLCHGSEFIGPMPLAGYAVLSSGLSVRDSPAWLDGILAATTAYLSSAPSIWGGRQDAWQVIIGGDQRRWWRIETRNWRYQTIHHSGQIQLQVGHQEVWVGHPAHILMFNDQVDVLATHAPQRGGTWEPLTAPGVVDHPGETPFDTEGNLQLDDSWHDVGVLQGGFR